jgi:hypothetical protein
MSRPPTSIPSQRVLTEMAGERVVEMLHWRTGDDLDFAVVIWPRHGDGKATTYVSSNDTALAVKLSALIGDHKSG